MAGTDRKGILRPMVMRRVIFVFSAISSLGRGSYLLSGAASVTALAQTSRRSNTATSTGVQPGSVAIPDGWLSNVFPTRDKEHR